MKKLMLVMCTLALVLAMAAVAKETTTVNGWVSDTKCAAKGMSATHAECAKKCIEAGHKAVFVSEADKKVWSVDNPETLKGHEGHYVAVTGNVDAEKGRVHVESVKMLEEKK